MTTDLDTLLTAGYGEIDDQVIPARRGSGRRPRLSDAELVCLAVAQVLLGVEGARRWVRCCQVRLGHLVPYLPGQPGYHKRVTAAAPLVAAAIRHLASISPSWCDQLRLIDATLLPCATSRDTGRRCDLAGFAGDGSGASHSRYYWGGKLSLLAAPDGLPITWCLANPKIGEREVGEDLLTSAGETGLVRPGTTVLADKGLAGRAIETTIAQLGVHLLRPDRRDEKIRRHGDLGGVRPWIESIFDTAKGQLGLDRHGGRTPAGVAARLSQRLLALAAALWHNWTINAPDKRSLIAYDH